MRDAAALRGRRQGAAAPPGILYVSAYRLWYAGCQQKLAARGVVHWSSDKWLTVQDDKTIENAFGVHLADLAVAGLQPGSTIVFTFFWPEASRWENVDFTVGVEAG